MSVGQEAQVPSQVRAPRRLAAVQATGLLDTDADEAFDRLSTLAATLLAAPSAFVTIVDERRSFWKSCVGAAAAAGVRHNAVEESFCQYVIASGEPLVVGDAVADPLTRDNPSVRLMGVAAWAGYPLHSPDGQVLGTFCVVDDVTREWTERDLQVLETLAHAASGEVALRMAARAAQQQARRHELVCRALASLNRTLDPASDLRALVAAVVPELAESASVHVLDQPVPSGVAPALPLRTRRFAAEARPGIPVPDLEPGTWGAGEPVTEAVANGRLVVGTIADGSVPVWVSRNQGDAHAAAGLHSWAATPVVVDGNVVAVATFALYGELRRWGAEDLDLLTEIAGYTAVALGHGMSYQRSRETALILQRSLLADPPPVAGLQIAVRYRPAGDEEVGGDWYDVFEPSPGVVALAVGDVVGHDIVAAAAMGQLRSVLRTLSVDDTGSPAAVLDRLATINTRLSITPFATVLLARLSRRADSWSVRWSSAGHPPGLLVEGSGSARVLWEGAGTALAAGIDVPHADGHVELAPGSTLVLFTDGLVERRGVDIGHAVEELALRAGRLARQPVDLLCDELLRGAPTTDDIALIAVRAPAGARA